MVTSPPTELPRTGSRSSPAETQKADVEYQLLARDTTRRAVISLTAVDAVTRLAQESRPDGVGTIDELPWVLEGCGVPWSVNGNGNQVPASTVTVASNDQATAVDQVAVTRDSRGGYAWVDRRGVLKAWDADKISTTVAATLAEADYTADFGISYATDRVVNVVQVEAYEVNPATARPAPLSIPARAGLPRRGLHPAVGRLVEDLHGAGAH
jgi:hypothetical protein